jgi:urease accessory protein
VGGAATQVLQMVAGEAAQDLTLRAGAGGRLLWLPEPLILFGGAAYRQRTRVELGPGALVVLLDVLVPGRLARGERFRFRRYEARVEICDAAGRLLAAERALVAPAEHDPTAPGLFGALPVLGSLYLLGHGIDARALAEELQAALGAQGGAGSLPGGAGVLARVAGEAPSAVRGALLRAWDHVAGRIDPPTS